MPSHAAAKRDFILCTWSDCGRSHVGHPGLTEVVDFRSHQQGDMFLILVTGTAQRRVIGPQYKAWHACDRVHEPVATDRLLRNFLFFYDIH
jgi:hypothetical protein